MPAIFRSKKRLKDNYWVAWYPNYQWRSSNLNTGVVAPDIHVKSPGDNGQGIIHVEFKNGLLECAEFEKYNSEYAGFDIPGIVEERIRRCEHFGVFFDYEHVITQEDLNRAQASQTTQRVLQKHAELVSQGLHLDEIEQWLETAGKLRREGMNLSDALLFIQRGRAPEPEPEPEDDLQSEIEKRAMFGNVPESPIAGRKERVPAKAR